MTILWFILIAIVAFVLGVIAMYVLISCAITNAIGRGLGW